MWENLLEDEGFKRVISLGQSTEDSPQHVILAESNGEVWLTNTMHQANQMVQPSASTRVVKPLTNTTEEKPIPQRAVSKNEYLKPFVEGQVLDNFADVLQLEPQEFDTNTPYTEYGVDSILAVEIIKKLNDKLAIELRTTDLFNYPTIRQLADHIVDEFGHAIDAQEYVNLTASDKLFEMPKEVYMTLDEVDDEGELFKNQADEEMLKIIEEFKQGQLEIGEVKHLLRTL
jgi:acyl carrier protein